MNPKDFQSQTVAAQAWGWVDKTRRAVVSPIHVFTTYVRDPDNRYRSGRIHARADSPAFDPAALAAGLNAA